MMLIYLEKKTEIPKSVIFLMYVFQVGQKRTLVYIFRISIFEIFFAKAQ